ncbi:WD repeat-containing protein slp1 [Malassezia vespertilionis]|uniref:Cdc20p n=1 Tax=Malassezia vespertilionis TaxID=2020962 RepID=A0A2N1J7C2_9BASI|nr:WD repeat-containing protein slp1 [Malassezia vespertilionis]PKI82457.1 Cdc20p [Malassezia vespertilionis]WFD08041.1 WD repeat-containing protein slp1 [Malassezia vespertilionis]
MASLGIESPLADVSVNVRPRSTVSPARGKPGKSAPKLRQDKEDRVPVFPSEADTRGIVSRDWDGPELTTTRRRSAATVSRGDRYIPNRELGRNSAPSTQPFLEDGGGDTLASTYSPERRGSVPDTMPDPDAAIALEDVCSVELGQRILTFSAAPPTSSGTRDARSRYTPKSKTLPSSLLAANRRRIPMSAERVLDAPAIVSDFYSNVLDWSSQNVIAIALQSAVHTWNSETGETNFLLDLEEESERVGGRGMVNSLQWDANGTVMAVGTDRGYTQIWDVVRGVRLRTLRPDPHGGTDNTAINTLAWAPDGTLNCGYGSGLIREHDVRQRDSITRSLERAHGAQVCGLTWRADSALLASGGNDNVVKVWDRRTSVAKMRKENHNAAVRALAWSPHHSSMLATGGGSTDRCIHFWNTTQNTRVQTIQTDAQITSLQWAPHYREIVSAHGVGSAEGNDGMMCVWAHPSGQKVGEINAHEGRVLHTSLSPDGQLIASVGSDESLKIWRVFEQSAELSKGGQRGILGSMYKGMCAGKGQNGSSRALR